MTLPLKESSVSHEIIGNQSDLWLSYEDKGDLEKTEFYLKQAADQGTASSRANLGFFYLRHPNLTRIRHKKK